MAQTGEDLDAGQGGAAGEQQQEQGGVGAGQPAGPPGAAAGGSSRRVLEGDLPPEALKARLEREAQRAAQAERARVLRELGIEDPAKWREGQQQREKELQALKEQEEKRKRAQLTEAERLRQDLQRAQQERQELERKLQEAEEARVSEQQEVVVQRTAMQYVAPKYYRHARLDFVEYVQQLAKTDPQKLAAMDEREIARWFERYVTKEYPEYALAKANGQPPARRQPITTGAKASPPLPTKEPAQVEMGGKTFKPGQPNSLGKQELKQALGKLGLKGW